MPQLAIICASVRKDRKSSRVALYFKGFIEERKLADVEVLDLLDYNFPVFHERLPYLQNPPQNVVDFAARFRSADGIIIVTPEYNGGYPASLKNVIDLLTSDWRKKPVAISTSSDGDFGGSQCLTSLQFSLWKIKAWTVPAMFPVPRVHLMFSEEGKPLEKDKTDKRAETFISELLWCIEAKTRMQK